MWRLVAGLAGCLEPARAGRDVVQHRTRQSANGRNRLSPRSAASLLPKALSRCVSDSRPCHPASAIAPYGGIGLPIALVTVSNSSSPRAGLGQLAGHDACDGSVAERDRQCREGARIAVRYRKSVVGKVLRTPTLAPSSIPSRLPGMLNITSEAA